MNKGKLAVKLLIFTILVALIANAPLVFAQTSLPVSNAFVTASGNGFGTDSSDTQGFYNITSFLDTGNYSVEASATGYIDTTIQNVSVTAGIETPNVNFLMPISGGISGRMTDAVSGAPLPDVIVQAVNVSGGVQYGSSAVTDSNGNYTIITNLATGTYNVTATFSSGHVTKRITGISVIAGVMTKNVDIALDRSAIISGTVTDSVTTAVLEGITIYALTPSGGFITAATTNSSGKYTLNTDLGTGTYNVSALFPTNYLPKTVGNFAVVAGNQYTVNMALDKSGIISGRITHGTSGAPLSNALVTAIGGSFVGYAYTNSTGYYRITDGLGTATYLVYASYGDGLTPMPGVGVTQGQETGNINLQVTPSPSGTITGRVTNATSGNPIESASVNAEGDNGAGFAVTNSTGHYMIDTGLATETYNVTVEALGFVQQSQNVSVAINQVTSNVNFQLQTKASGRISGRVQTSGNVIPEFTTTSMIVVIFAVASIAIMIKKLKTTRLKSAAPL